MNFKQLTAVVFQALLDSGRMKLLLGDGRLGYVSDGPYDAIHVGAAAPTIPQSVSEKLSL